MEWFEVTCPPPHKEMSWQVLPPNVPHAFFIFKLNSDITTSFTFLSYLLTVFSGILIKISYEEMQILLTSVSALMARDLIVVVA